MSACPGRSFSRSSAPLRGVTVPGRCLRKLGARKGPRGARCSSVTTVGRYHGSADARPASAGGGRRAVSGLALALVLLAAVIHASWNLLAKEADDKLAFLWCGALASCVLYLP